MSKLTLGLDLGPNSIGWALISDKNLIVQSGVRIFPEGVDRDTQGREVSKNAQRRMKRLLRRQTKRRAARKRQLLEKLIALGWLPDFMTSTSRDSDQAAYAKRTAWQSEQFRQSDPYELRTKGLTERLELHEFARVLLHLAQHRGFKSNRKADRERKKETSGMLAEISQLQGEINASTLPIPTLGAYLQKRKSEHPGEEHLVKLRGKHTARVMYEAEFDLIWDKQHDFYPNELTDELKTELRDRIIYFQRPIKPPSADMIGRCELLPRLARCPRADRRFQKFRMHLEVNHLRVIELSTACERDITKEERGELISLLSRKKELTFDEIRKKLFEQSEQIRFNLENGKRKAIKGLACDYHLSQKKVLGKEWFALDETVRDHLVAAIIEDDEPRLTQLFQESSLDDSLVPILLESIPLESGYASYSLHAIKKLLPFVVQGMSLTSKDETIPSAYRKAGFLAPWERKKNKENFLDTPPQTANPIVNSALRDVRKVVNCILRELVYKTGDKLIAVHLEMTRELKSSAKQRDEMIDQMRENESNRKAATAWVQSQGEKPSRGKIERYLLWKEQREFCAYCDRLLSPMMILDGNATDVDHILPYSQSLEDSRANRVVAHVECNRDKGQRTPKQWLFGKDSDRYEKILLLAKKNLSVAKYKKFLVDQVDAEEFIARQLNDTSYITSLVRTYLESLGCDIICIKGKQTAALRWRWGLDTILSQTENSPSWREPDKISTKAKEKIDNGQKNRLDHRHHAVDAIILALTDRSRLQALAKVYRAEWAEEAGMPFEEPSSLRTQQQLATPWPTFRTDAAKSIEQINVSYRVNRGVSGALHEDTIYGPTSTPGEVVVRKSLEALTLANVEDIRDAVVRAKVMERLTKHGITWGRGSDSAIGADVWKEPLYMNIEKKIPIRKVRIIKREQTVQPIRHGLSWVKPGNNHHLCLFASRNSKGKTVKMAEFTTLLAAMQRIKNKETVIVKTHPSDPLAEFLFSLSNGELVLMEHEGREEIYVFTHAGATSSQMFFRHHCAAGKSSDKFGRTSKKPGTFVGKKITVDPIGRVRWAND